MLFSQIFFLLFLQWFHITLGVAIEQLVSNRTIKLPFKCPYKLPEGSLKPLATGDTEFGLLPTLYEDNGLANSSSNFYAKYKAALALVPCDAKAIAAFTDIGDLQPSSTISVLFVYEKPAEDLKRWLV